jgi:hypothetical protein
MDHLARHRESASRLQHLDDKVALHRKTHPSTPSLPAADLRILLSNCFTLRS